MKKLYLVLCLLLIPCLASAGVVASGSVTQANAKKSLVDGAGFIDISGELVTDGGFDNWIGDELNDWTETQSDAAEDPAGVAKITSTAIHGGIYQSVNVTAGNMYCFTFDYANDIGSTAQYAVYDIQNSGFIINYTSLPDTQIMTENSASFVAPVGCTSMNISLRTGIGEVSRFDNISFKETLSPYADADSGDHKHILKLIDSAGKVAWGYVGASGGGETLGSELHVSDDVGFINMGSDSCTLTVSGTALTSTWFGDSSAGGLIKTITTGTSARSRAQYKIGAACYYYGTIAPEGISYTTYFSLSTLWNGGFRIYYVYDGTATMSAKQVTDCSTNGLHILSTKSGSVQNWAEVETGFSFNDPSGYTYEIKTIGRGASIW